MAEKIITELELPVSKWWILKNTQSIMAIPFLAAFLLFSMLPTELVSQYSVTPPETVPTTWQRVVGVAGLIAFWLFITVAQACWNYLRLKFFHYSVGVDNLEIRSGVISRQERHMPYSRLQNVYIKQDLLDRIFRLKQVVVENAAGAGFADISVGNSGSFMSTSKGYDSLGNLGNSFSVPGLKPSDAEALKMAILEKINEAAKNSDGASGL